MKNKGAKSRCFVCFRPVESGSGGQKKVSGGNPKSSARVTYISVSGDDLKPKILQPEKPDAPEAVDGSRSKRARGNLSRIIKSVVSESLSVRFSAFLLSVFYFYFFYFPFLNLNSEYLV